MNVTDKLFTWKIRVAIFTFSPTSIFMMNDTRQNEIVTKQEASWNIFPSSAVELWKCIRISSFFFLIIAYILTSARNPLWCASFRLPRQPYFLFSSFSFCFVTRSCLNVGYYAVYIYTYYVSVTLCNMIERIPWRMETRRKGETMCCSFSKSRTNRFIPFFSFFRVYF